MGLFFVQADADVNIVHIGEEFGIQIQDLLVVQTAGAGAQQRHGDAPEIELPGLFQNQRQQFPHHLHGSQGTGVAHGDGMDDIAAVDPVK